MLISANSLMKVDLVENQEEINKQAKIIQEQEDKIRKLAAKESELASRV